MNGADVARTSLVVFLVLVVQHTLLDNVRVDGAHPEAMLLVVAAAGYVGGPQRGAVVGFFTGLVTDLLLPTTFGFSALVGCLLGYVTGTATRSLVRSSRWLAVLSLTAATVAGLVGYAGLASLLGQPGALQAYLPPALVVATPAAAVLALPVLFLVRWAVPPPVAPAATAPTGLGR
jgi:rod shape-determining protein MreD